jgi:hypothetical protein
VLEHVERVRAAIERTRLAEKTARKQVEAASEALVRAQQERPRDRRQRRRSAAGEPGWQRQGGRRSRAGPRRNSPGLQRSTEESDMRDAIEAAERVSVEVEAYISSILAGHARLIQSPCIHRFMAYFRSSWGNLAMFTAITGPQLRLPIWPCVDPNSA